MKKTLIAEFLNCGTIHISDGTVLCWGLCCPVLCRMFNGIHGLHPLGARSTLYLVMRTKNVWTHCRMSPGGKITQADSRWFQPTYWKSHLFWILVFCSADEKGKTCWQKPLGFSEVGLLHQGMVVDAHVHTGHVCMWATLNLWTREKKHTLNL